MLTGVQKAALRKSMLATVLCTSNPQSLFITLFYFILQIKEDRGEVNKPFISSKSHKGVELNEN